MTLVKECDVKMHFSSRRDKGLQRVHQVDKPAVSVIPVADMAIEASVPTFADNFSLDHSSPGGTISAVVIVTNPGDTQMPETHNTPRS